jgi:hypothetical protein
MKPVEDRAPKSKREATLVEEVSPGFDLPFAKRTRVAIWPSTLGQAVGGPNPYLNS